jgi:hypothetical protein
MEFKDFITTKYGMAAESIGSEFILNKGYEAYAPSFEGSHSIDYIALSGTSQFYLDVKCKAKMMYHPYTGIDERDVEKYKTLGKDVYLLFVDVASCAVYGQWLKKLDNQPMKIFPGKGLKENVITWPLSGMSHYRYLTEQECESLKVYEQSNYKR